MVAEFEVTKRLILKDGGFFDIPAIYKVAKDVAESEKYDFVEMTHKSKPEKYGHIYEFEFGMENRFDYFAKNNITVEFFFDSLKKVKSGSRTLEAGNGRVKITLKLVLDYQNAWGKSAFFRFLFSLYQKYIAKKRIEDQYIVPSIIFTEKLYKSIKDAMELHH